MEDVFTGEHFLLYSKSIGQILREHGVSLWFNLIGFNGHCWQTYGPIGNFQSFDADDVFFYATELDRSITSEATLFNYLEKNPVPFMMLMTGANYPLIMNNGYEVVQVTGESPLKTLNISELKKNSLWNMLMAYRKSATVNGPMLRIWQKLIMKKHQKL